MGNREKQNTGQYESQSSYELADKERFLSDPVIAAILNPSPEEQKIQAEWAQSVREQMGISQTDTSAQDVGRNFSLELRISSLEKENASLSDGMRELRIENSWLRQDVIPALRHRIEQQNAELARLRPVESLTPIHSDDKGTLFEDRSPQKIDENTKPKDRPDSFSKKSETIETEVVNEHSAMLAAFLEKHKSMLERSGKNQPPEELVEKVFELYENTQDLDKRRGSDSVLLMRIEGISYFKKILNNELEISPTEPPEIREFRNYVVRELGKDFINTALVVAKSEHAEFIKASKR